MPGTLEKPHDKNEYLFVETMKEDVAKNCGFYMMEPLD